MSATAGFGSFGEAIRFNPDNAVGDSAHSTSRGDVLVVGPGAVHTLRAGRERAVVAGILHRLG